MCPETSKKSETNNYGTKSTKTTHSNSNSRGRTNRTTSGTSTSRDQKPQQSREQKRKNWAKRSKPVAKPVALALPAREYVSVCCNAPAHKPKAGQKEVAKDPESGKMKSGSKGLGHWRCGQCGKTCIVSCKKKEIENVNSIESDKQKVWKADSDRVGGKE